MLNLLKSKIYFKNTIYGKLLQNYNLIEYKQKLNQRLSLSIFTLASIKLNLAFILSY